MTVYIHKWTTFKTVANFIRSGHPDKFTPRSEGKPQSAHSMLRFRKVFRGNVSKKNTMAWVC